MVARAERAHLGPLPLLGRRRDAIGTRARDASVLLHERPGLLRSGRTRAPRPRTRRLRGASRRSPSCRGGHRLPFELARRRWASVRKSVVREHALALEHGSGSRRPSVVQESYAARDVEADAADRQDASLFGVEGGDATDREAIAPVRVGHAHGRADDAGQARDVEDLLADLLVEVLEELFSAGETHRDAHVPFHRDLAHARRHGSEVLRLHTSTTVCARQPEGP